MARRVSSAGASVMSTLGLTMLELDNFVKLNAELIQKKGESDTDEPGTGRGIRPGEYCPDLTEA